MKKVVSIILIVLIIVGITSTCFAFERKDHDKYMSEVLFKNFKEIENYPDLYSHLEAIESASYLCIDQFNNSGQNDLDYLKQYGVKGLPNSISDIAFNASGVNHRSYTHRGWDFTLYPDMSLWEKRKSVLRNTLSTVFDFKGNESQLDGLCEIIYDIHIIGDHMDDESYKINNGQKIEMGGRRDNYDIIHSLLNAIEKTFFDQKHTHKYSSLVWRLKWYNMKYGTLVKSEGGVNTNEKFSQYKELTVKVKQLLTMYLPEMLKEEQFFREVFY